ncbi:hypothetical protein G6F59_018335 [Rhizopus arrhizus]|nr:hypothetical protein G6F59_018335 [Rhizopus arrhizus]
MPATGARCATPALTPPSPSLTHPCADDPSHRPRHRFLHPGMEAGPYHRRPAADPRIGPAWAGQRVR